jgi:KipI family sensor histidine kinase inhibitor
MSRTGLGASGQPTDVRRAGSAALLTTFATLAEVVAFRAAVAGAALPGVTETVSGARSLLVRYDTTLTDESRLRAALGAVTTGPAHADTAPAARDDDAASVLVPVTYDGEDLDDVATLAGMTRAELVAWHTRQVWTSAFCGFAPGFSYLTATEPSLDLPRRNTSRTAVPSGAVALAGEFSAVYPRTSPGGWQLIGRTTVPMWSLDREPPALAPAGTRIRFVEAGAA